MTFKGYENSVCPLVNCPKNCEHSHATNDTTSVARLSTEDPETTTRARIPRYNSSQSTGNTSTTVTDDSRSIASAGPSRTQSNTTTPNTSPSPERQKTKDKENIYRKAPWQPSLAAGGPVDLLDTFTPTPYGTFSFGGKSKRTSGTAKSTPKPLAPHPKTSLPKSPTTAGTMAPLDSSTEGNFLPLTAAPLAPENIPAPEQVDRANDSGGALAVPHSGGVSDEYVPAVPLAVRSTNTHPAPPTQHDEEGEAIAHGTSAQAEADPLGAALEGLDYPRPNEQCNGGVNGAVHGLANGTVGPGEPLFARRRAGTGGSNPMAESSLIGAAKVPIHPDSWLRREIATPAPLMDDTNPGPPSSISSYSRRLSEASREEIEKVRELQ